MSERGKERLLCHRETRVIMSCDSNALSAASSLRHSIDASVVRCSALHSDAQVRSDPILPSAALLLGSSAGSMRLTHPPDSEPKQNMNRMLQSVCSSCAPMHSERGSRGTIGREGRVAVQSAGQREKKSDSAERKQSRRKRTRAPRAAGRSMAKCKSKN